jgi:hypothetical protein
MCAETATESHNLIPQGYTCNLRARLLSGTNEAKRRVTMTCLYRSSAKAWFSLIGDVLRSIVCEQRRRKCTKHFMHQ